MFQSSGNKLLCFLNDTGIGEYENWLVKFFREDQHGSIGVCVKDDDNSAGDESGVYYDINEHACVLNLEEEVVGTYFCSLFIRHMETGKKKLECHEKITIPKTSKKFPPTVMLVVSAVGVGIVIILVMIVLPVIAIVKWRRRHQRKFDFTVDFYVTNCFG